MTEAQPSRIAFLRERVEIAERAASRTTFDVPLGNVKSRWSKSKFLSLSRFTMLEAGEHIEHRPHGLPGKANLSDFFADAKMTRCRRLSIRYCSK